MFIHMFVLDLEDCNQVREKKGWQLLSAYGKKSFLLDAVISFTFLHVDLS